VSREATTIRNAVVNAFVVRAAAAALRGFSNLEASRSSPMDTKITTTVGGALILIPFWRKGLGK
jgi:hypothetical protein